MELAFEKVIKDSTGGNYKFQQNEYLSNGDLPIIDQGADEIGGYTNEIDKKYKGDLPVIVFGDHTKILKFVDYDFALGADGTKILKVKDGFDAKFIYYYLKRFRLPNNTGYSRHYKYLKENSFNRFDPTYQLYARNLLDKADSIRKKRKETIKLADEFLRSTFLEMFGDPVVNKKKWNEIKFENVGTLERGRSKHRPRNAAHLLGGPYPLIQTGDVANSDGYIREYKSTYSEEGLKQSKLWPEGTLCITIAANIAKTGILTFDACFPDSIVGYTPNEETRTEYIQFWMSFLQKILEEKAPESAQKNINLEILRNLEIPIPPIELQNKFAEIVEKTEKLKEKYQQSLDESENLFNSLMQRAFKGEL